MDVGRYVAPAPVEPVASELIADEGLLVAASAVRMAVRNRIIVRALRDGLPYDEAEVRSIVRAVLDGIAVEKEQDALRLEQAVAEAAERPGVSRHQNDYREGDVDLLRRRAEVSRHLATRLREVSDNDASVDELAEAARQGAWEEIAASLESRLDARPEALADTEKYQRDRAIRMRQVATVDLAELARSLEPEY